MMSDFLAHFLTYLPTPVRFCPNIDFQFYYMVSDFGKSTYLPKKRTSFMDVPQPEKFEFWVPFCTEWLKIWLQFQYILVDKVEKSHEP